MKKYKIDEAMDLLLALRQLAFEHSYIVIGYESEDGMIIKILPILSEQDNLDVMEGAITFLKAAPKTAEFWVSAERSPS